LIGGWNGLFRQPALSFPSGHATLAVATAVSLTILLPRWRWIWFLIALMVAVERVLENAHFVSDVVAGVGVGTVSALLANHLLKRYWPIKQTELAGAMPTGK
jgi:membrane-associated phospholipid phosphatase